MVFARVFRELPQHGGLVTRTRSQLLSDGAWRASEHYNEYRRPSEIDDCLYSCCVLPAGGSVSSAIDVIAIHRAAHEKPFGEWERRFVDEVQPVDGRRSTGVARDTRRVYDRIVTC